MEQSAKLTTTPSPQAPALTQGSIRELKHVSAGTDVASTHLVAAHNSVGYGFIHSPGGDVFFDASAITNIPFDRLIPNMSVEYTLDQAPYLRTSRITVVADDRAAITRAALNRASELPARP